MKSKITTLDGNSFNTFGFGMNFTKTSYYILNSFDDRIYILNDEYQFLSQISWSVPTKMITIGYSVYIAGYNYIFKTDTDLKVLLQFKDFHYGPRYHDRYYNSTNSLMYVTATNFNSIHVFDLNLNLVDTMPISSLNSWSITGFNNRKYVGCNDGTIPTNN
jgi:hypothetical protein